MCGIVGYVGKQKAASIIIEGLKRLEYRGYDSAGVAVLQDDRIDIAKKAGRVEVLAKEAAKHRFTGTTGIGHTRWATHGGVTDANAHPHVSSDGKFALIHNGVIENYSSIKKFLLSKGYTFSSETDTEALVNLIAYHYQKEPSAEDKSRFLESVRRSLMHVEGTYGIAVICTDSPGELVAARKASPLILGVGDAEFIIASDVSALISRTQNVVYLKDGELVHLTGKNFSIITQSEEDVSPVVNKVTWTAEAAEIGSYAHYMEKEIFEQPIALENAMRGRFSADGSTAQFGGLNLTPIELRQIDRFVFCGCGTAWHACLVAEQLPSKSNTPPSSATVTPPSTETPSSSSSASPAKPSTPSGPFAKPNAKATRYFPSTIPADPPSPARPMAAAISTTALRSASPPPRHSLLNY